MKNPYIELVKTIRQEGAAYNSPNIQLGEVFNISPLVIKIGELQLTKDNLLIADYLLDYKRNMVIDAEVSGETKEAAVGDHGTHQHKLAHLLIDKKEVNLISNLQKQDLVALIQISVTKFLILCKVVEI